MPAVRVQQFRSILGRICYPLQTITPVEGNLDDVTLFDPRSEG